MVKSSASPGVSFVTPAAVRLAGGSRGRLGDKISSPAITCRGGGPRGSDGRPVVAAPAPAVVAIVCSCSARPSGEITVAVSPL